MRKQQENRDENNKKCESDQMPNSNGVFITVYEESPWIAKPISEKKMKPNPVLENPKGSSRLGYDRRAQLLAYTRELRTADGSDYNEKFQWYGKKSRSWRYKSKKWKRLTAAPRKLGISFLGIFRRKKGQPKYQRIPSYQENNKCCNRGMKLKHWRRKSWTKLKRMFRGLSFVWIRRKGGGK